MRRQLYARSKVHRVALLALICAALAACSAEPIGPEAGAGGVGLGDTQGATDAAFDASTGGDDTGGADALAADDGQDGARSSDDATSHDATSDDATDEFDVDLDDGNDDPDAIDDADPSDEPDGGEDAKLPAEAPVVFVVEDPPVTANVATIAKGAWTEAVAVDTAVVLARAPAKGAEPASVALLGPVDGQITPVAGEIGALVASMVRQSVVLVWHADGVAAQVKTKLLPSPLAAALGAPIAQWRRGDGDDLWLLAGGKLWLWRDGVLATVSWPDDAAAGAKPAQGSINAAHLAWGCAGLAGPSLALSGPNGLRIVRVAADGAVQSAVWIEGRAVGAVVCDFAGVLWAATEGELVSRGVGGNWTTWSFGVVSSDPTVQGLSGLDGLGGFWIDVAGVRWRQELGVWRRVLAVPAAATWSDHVDGGLVGVAAGAVVRVETVAPTPKPPVSWAKQIKPIYDASCALCHGPEGVSTKLDSAKKWKDKIDIVLQYVQSGAMPLPPKLPLGSSERALIAKWKSDGYQP